MPKTLSRIRQFGSETVHICELMGVFLGELLENQSPSTPNEPARLWPFQPPAETAAAPHDAVGLRMHSDNRKQLPAQEFSSEVKAIDSLAVGDKKPNASAATDYNLHKNHFDCCGYKEEEQLPTMDELLRQLGVAFKDGSLPELGQPITKAALRAGDTLVAKPTVAPSSAHIVKIALATQVGDPVKGI